MRVIFLADVPGSGMAGEIKDVKNGYGRNYLLPKQLATLATHDQLQRLEAIRKAGEERRIREETDIRALSEYLSQITVNLAARVGPTGRFYGSVTSAQIAEELERLTEREFDRRSIHLKGPIQEPGEYQAELRLAQGFTAEVTVSVVGHDMYGRVAGQPREETIEAAQTTADDTPVAEATEAPEAIAEEPAIAEVEAVAQEAQATTDDTPIAEATQAPEAIAEEPAIADTEAVAQEAQAITDDTPVAEATEAPEAIAEEPAIAEVEAVAQEAQAITDDTPIAEATQAPEAIAEAEEKTEGKSSSES